jgi:toxin-antitoxin system PIN domain toxin
MTPDVNVLVAASRSDNPHHPVAIRWLDEALDACALGQGLALLPMVTAGFLRLVTHPRVFVEPTPLAAAQEFLAAVLAVDGVALLPLSGEWPLLEPLCRQHQLVGNASSAGWIAAAVLARRQVLVTFDRDFLPLLPARQLLLLEG